MFPVNGYFQTGAVSRLRNRVRASERASTYPNRTTDKFGLADVRASYNPRVLSVLPDLPVLLSWRTSARATCYYSAYYKHANTHTHTHTQIDCVTRHRRSYSSRRGRRAASLTLHPSIPVTRYSLAAFFPLVSPAYPREHSKLPKYLTYVSTGASTLHRSNLSFSTRLSTSRVSVSRPYLIQMSIHIIKDHTYILFSYVLD